jgi:hypothetical protein
MNQIPTAFPWTHDNVTCTGMTLRDYFAAKAMQGLLTIPAETLSESKTDKHERLDSYVSYLAYTMADAMLKARETTQGETHV